jgi:hypothetical protein
VSSLPLRHRVYHGAWRDAISLLTRVLDVRMLSVMDSITKDQLKAISADVAQALLELGAKHGVVFKLKRGTFGAVGALTFDILPVSDGGVTMTREAAAFMESAHLFGLATSDLGCTFMQSGEAFIVAGLTNGRKRPVLVKRARDGKMFVFDATTVRDRLNGGRS